MESPNNADAGGHFDLGFNSDEDVELDANIIPDDEVDADADVTLDTNNRIKALPIITKDFHTLVSKLGYLEFANHICDHNEMRTTTRVQLTKRERNALKKTKQAMKDLGETVLKPNVSTNKIVKNGAKASDSAPAREYIVTRQSVDDAWYTHISETYGNWMCPDGWTIEQQDMLLQSAISQMRSEKVDLYWQTRARAAGDSSLAEPSNEAALLISFLQGRPKIPDGTTRKEREELAEELVFGGFEEHSTNAGDGAEYDDDGDVNMS